MLDQLWSWRRYAARTWRHRWYGLACAWIVCIGGWIAIGTMPSVYESSARLYVDADAVLTPLLRGLALDNTAAGQLEVMQSTLLSRPNLELVIAKTPLQLAVRTQTDQQNLVNALSTRIKLVPQSRNLFTISYQNADPLLAYDVVQAIMNIFIESRSGNNRADMDNARTFLQQQITTYEQQLRQAENARADFLSKYLDLLPAEGGGSSHLDAARANATNLAGALIDAKAKRAMLERELTTTQPTVVTESDAASSGGELSAAQQKLQDMLVTDTENHPDVQEQRHRIADLQSHGGGGGGHGGHTASQPNPVYSQLKVEIVETAAQIDSLQRQVGEATAERDRLEVIARGAPGVAAKYVNLNRDYDTLRSNYSELLARRESMRLSAAADEEADKIKLRIVDPAQISRSPVSPPRVLLMFVVLVAGLAAGVAAAFGLGQFDRSFSAVEELETIGLPVMVGISLLPEPAEHRRFIVNGAVLLAGVLLLVGVCGGLIYHAIQVLDNAA